MPRFDPYRDPTCWDAARAAYAGDRVDGEWDVVHRPARQFSGSPRSWGDPRSRDRVAPWAIRDDRRGAPDRSGRRVFRQVEGPGLRGFAWSPVFASPSYRARPGSEPAKSA